MAFSQSTIISVAPPQYRGAFVYISWTTSSPAGTWFQAYVGSDLAWWGTATSCWLPAPSTGGERITIGAVNPGEETINFSTSFAPPPKRRAELAWQGGAFESPDLAGFRVYGSTTAGGAVSYAAPLATIAAYPTGIIPGAFGVDGFGLDSFGTPPGDYSWTSGPLANGDWSFAVVPYDSAGNVGAAQMTTVAIHAPPAEVPPYPDGARLHYTTIDVGGSPVVTLTWQPSPG